MSTRRYRADPAALGDALAFVAAFGDAAALARADALRLRLATEELFANTVEHGRARATSVELSLRADAGEVHLHFADDGDAFDPVEAATRPDDPAPPARVGGVGLKLVQRLASRWRYRREDGWNRIELTLARARAAE